MTQYRQGDLLVTVIAQLPEGLMPQTSTVIAQGEATGHAHRLEAGRVWKDTLGNLFLEVPKSTQIVHEEHYAIHLPAGTYRVTRQREYTPRQERRRVRD